MKNFKTTELPKNHYINLSTNECISKSVNVCSKCYLNFTTAAFEIHADSNCGNSKELKLVKLRNQHGAIVYKYRNEPDPKWKFQVIIN
jgi:hypothetical protein